MKRSADQADLDAAAAAGADPAAAAAAAPGLPPAVASAIEQLEEIWGGLPVRHKNKFRDYAYMLFVGHEAEHGEAMDPHEAEEASDERQLALSAVQEIAGAPSPPPRPLRSLALRSFPAARCAVPRADISVGVAVRSGAPRGCAKRCRRRARRRLQLPAAGARKWPKFSLN